VSIDLAEGADHGYFNDFAGFFHSSLYHVDEFLASIGYVEGAPLFTIME